MCLRLQTDELIRPRSTWEVASHADGVGHNVGVQPLELPLSVDVRFLHVQTKLLQVLPEPGSEGE